jgi:hypothetical protein
MSELDAALSAASKLFVVRASAVVAEARLQGSTQGSTMVPDTSILDPSKQVAAAIICGVATRWCSEGYREQGFAALACCVPAVRTGQSARSRQGCSLACCPKVHQCIIQKDIATCRPLVLGASGTQACGRRRPTMAPPLLAASWPRRSSLPAGSDSCDNCLLRPSTRPHNVSTASSADAQDSCTMPGCSVHAMSITGDQSLTQARRTPAPPIRSNWSRRPSSSWSRPPSRPETAKRLPACRAKHKPKG